MKISIVIPTLDEHRLIAKTIESCRLAGAEEIIVCDGGSHDGTQTIANELRCKVVRAKTGRGRQLAAGAAQATGDVILFLHADTQLSVNCLKQIRQCVMESSRTCVWGCYCQKIQARNWRYRLVERGNRWRAAVRHVVYGDQAMWITRELYQKTSGFADVPLMEDVMMSDELKKISRPVILPGPITIPTRHWQRMGVCLTTLRNWYLFQRFRFGMSAEQVADRYNSGAR